MTIYRNRKLFFWIGLSAIVLLYALYYVFFLYGIALSMPLRGRHVVKFLFIAAVYLAGAFCVRRFAAPWMLRIWHGVYLLILVLLVLFGVYDWLIARTALELRGIADSLAEFLVSPILYVAMGIMGRRAVFEDRPDGQ
jgi:hypothetical protein